MAVSMKKVLLVGVATLAGVVALALLGFAVWAWTPLGPEPGALAALESDSRVSVTRVKGWTEFSPAGTAPETGFIFYPGGRVDWRSYAPLVSAVAERGYLAVIVPVTLNLALFDIEAAAPVIAAHPEIGRWAVGGHSLGGVAASIFAARHRDSVAGVAFWASYPVDTSLIDPETAAFGIPAILSVSGSLDGLATPAKIDASRTLLSESAQFVEIAGGNHAGFGDYGPQKGDNPATIPKEAQWKLTAEATAAFLESLPVGVR